MSDDEDTLTNVNPPQPVTPDVAPAAVPPVGYADATAGEPYTDWGPPSVARYAVALVVVLGISAFGAFVVWYFFGEKIWNTLSGDWT